jgi:hypothetical protein
MRYVCLALLLGSSPGLAEVKSASPAGFEIERKITVSAPSAQVFSQIGRIGEWWNPAHSYSGKAENLSLDLEAGDCFCEKLDNGGSIEHLRVVYVDPGNGVIRLQGGLGPLQSEAVAGTLTWSLKAVGGGTEITQNYAVSGTVRGGADKLAPIVDQVLGEQLDRLAGKFRK